MSSSCELPCPICYTSFSEQKAVVYERGYIYRRCPNCGLLYVNPQPNQAFILSRIKELEQQDFECTKTVFEKPREFFFRRELRHIKSFKPLGRLLDVGCGGGGFLKMAKELGYYVAGIEPNPNVALPLQSQSGIDIYCGTLEQAFNSGVVTSESYDVISMLDVLEHVPDPRVMLFLVRKILVPQGLAVIRVPNVDYFLLKYTTLSPFFKDRIAYLDPDHHLYYFNEKTLSDLVVQSGFEVLRIKYTYSRKLSGSTVVYLAKFLLRGLAAVAHVFNYKLTTCFTLYAKKK